MSNNSVRLESFTKKYGSKVACNKIDFQAGSNAITGLLGPNGAGKSTLLKTLCGELYPTSGLVCVYGNDRPEDIRRVTGYVPENPDLEKNLSVKELLILEAKLYGISNMEETVMNAVEFCNLEDVLFSKIGNLSKGYKQRVSLAKALCIKPKLLVLDEFSAGLDPYQLSQLRKRLKKLSKTTAIVFSTHHIEEASSLCDYIYIMNRGCVVKHGNEESLTKDSGCKNLEDAYLKLIEGSTNHE